VSAAYVPESPNLGVDIGTSDDATCIKDAENVILDVDVIQKASASLLFAKELLTRVEFDALYNVTLEINSVDTKGLDYNTQTSLSIWSMMGALSNTSNFASVFKTFDTILEAILLNATTNKQNLALHVKRTEVLRYKNVTLAIPPLNSGRSVVNACFRYYRASVVIFSTFSSGSNVGTVGVSASRSFSNKFDLSTLLNDPRLSEFVNDLGSELYKVRHCIGKTDKGPIMDTTEEVINKYRNALMIVCKDTLSKF